MKLLLPSTLLLLGISLSAQMPGMMSMQAATADGTSLGANHTLATDGIALGNRVKMTGYVDFIFMYDDEDGGDQTEDFSTASDADFFLTFHRSPPNCIWQWIPLILDLSRHLVVTALTITFHLTFGRQLTSLGFEADEAPGFMPHPLLIATMTTGQVLTSGVITKTASG